MTSPHRIELVLGMAFAAMLVLGCGGDGGGGPVEPPGPRVPTTVTVRPESATLTALGAELDLTAGVTDQHGAAMPSATVTWRSDDGSVVTVESKGARTARAVAAAPGETRVVATAGSATASVAVAVEQIPASIETEGDVPHALASGTSVRVSVGVQDRNGHSASGTRVAFRVREGGGTVDPESVVTDAQGLAEATWTLGPAGVPRRSR